MAPRVLAVIGRPLPDASGEKGRASYARRSSVLSTKSQPGRAQGVSSRHRRRDRRHQRDRCRDRGRCRVPLPKGHDGLWSRFGDRDRGLQPLREAGADSRSQAASCRGSLPGDSGALPGYERDRVHGHATQSGAGLRCLEAGSRYDSGDRNNSRVKIVTPASIRPGPTGSPPPGRFFFIQIHNQSSKRLPLWVTTPNTPGAWRIGLEFPLGFVIVRM